MIPKMLYNFFKIYANYILGNTLSCYQHSISLKNKILVTTISCPLLYVSRDIFTTAFKDVPLQGTEWYFPEKL